MSTMRRVMSRGETITRAASKLARDMGSLISDFEFSQGVAVLRVGLSHFDPEGTWTCKEEEIAGVESVSITYQRSHVDKADNKEEKKLPTQA